MGVLQALHRYKLRNPSSPRASKLRAVIASDRVPVDPNQLGTYVIDPQKIGKSILPPHYITDTCEPRPAGWGVEGHTEVRRRYALHISRLEHGPDVGQDRDIGLAV